MKVDHRKRRKNDPVLERAALEARNEFNHILAKNKIRHLITVKIHMFTGYKSNPISMYRSMSQFGYNTIFWVSTDIRRVMRRFDQEGALAFEDVIVNSLLHEYTHVILEWATKKDPALLRMIMESYSSGEEFSRDMIEELKGDNFIWNTHEILTRYVSTRFGA